MKQDCGTCTYGDFDPCPTDCTPGRPGWVEHPLIAIGRKDGIEKAIEVARLHQGESVMTVRMKIRALLEAKT